MTSRHAAALAFVCWYLMLPPQISGNVYFTASLSRWITADSYDSEARCREKLTSVQNGADSKVRAVSSKMFAKQKQGEKLTTNEILNCLTAGAAKEMAYRAQCVASDDPRLKESNSLRP
jgi:hypothetical protein